MMRPRGARLLMASALGFLKTAASELVEAATVSNVVVTATGWELRGATDGGCGLAGCDPRLTRDGEDNTVADSRWSCEPDMVSYNEDCQITFSLDGGFMVDHIMLYVHESDTAQVSIPFDLNVGYDNPEVSGLTSPGTALGEGQKINIPSSTEESYIITLTFTLTSGQYIDLSEVEIFLDVDDPDDYVIDPLDELYVVKASTVTNVVADASFWELDSEAGCGEAGCTPGLLSDGQDNTVAASRWSCQVEDAFYLTHHCELYLSMDEALTVSYVMVYVHEGDDLATDAIVFTANDYPYEGPFQTTPGTALGTGERFNLPRYQTNYLTFYFPNATASEIIAISEIEIYVEVTDTSVFVAAAEAWTEVVADDLSTVTVLASEALNDTSAAATRDGDDNTVAASRWSCDGGEWGYCVLFFEFNDDYTVSYLDLYMHESDDASQDPVTLDFCGCFESTSTYYPGGLSCDCTGSYPDEPIMTYVTKPGTPLGEPERVNLLNPLTSSIGIVCRNLTAAGGTIDISEIEIYFQVPDSTPTPAPFIDETPAPTSTSGSSPVPEETTSSLLEPPTSSLGGVDEDDDDDDRSLYSYYGAEADDGNDDTPAGSDPSTTPTPADGTNDVDTFSGTRATKGGFWLAFGGSLLVVAMSAIAV